MAFRRLMNASSSCPVHENVMVRNEQARLAKECVKRDVLDPVRHVATGEDREAAILRDRNLPELSHLGAQRVVSDGMHLGVDGSVKRLRCSARAASAENTPWGNR